MSFRPAVVEQSGVIAFRGPPDAMEIALVSSRRGRRWVIPKGLVEPFLDPGASAAKEAWEEAGLRGELSADPVGSYLYRKLGGLCDVAVYLLRVEAVLETWPESRWRSRVWLSASRAAERVQEPVLARLLRTSPQWVPTIAWRSQSQLPPAVRG